MKIFVIALVLCTGLFSFADENGKVVTSPANCQNSKFSSIQEVCNLVSQFGVVNCKITADSCNYSSQEMFTGAAIELSNFNDPRGWSGLGGLGPHYAVATACLMRDIADLPGRKIATSATASTLLGDVTAQQEVGFLSFNKSNGTWEGYHRLKACGPAVGCLDAYTQKFKIVPVTTDMKNSGKLAGQYKILESTGLDIGAEGLAQGISVALPGIPIPTPIGNVEAKPEFRFGRATGFILAPFDGNAKSSRPDPKFNIPQNKTYDVYGRNPGTNATNLLPAEQGGVKSPKGWLSQVALGSRDPNSKNPAWKAPAGVEFPPRPDTSFGTARSSMEKMPNAYLGASVQLTYSPIELIPKPLRDIGCSGIVRLCIDQLQVFARPTIDVNYTSQINFIQNEQNLWNGRTIGNTVPVADLRPLNVDQAKTGGVHILSATSSRFSLDAGLDFVIRLEINTLFSKIKKTLVNFHPRTTIAEKIDNATSQVSQSLLRSQATQQIANKKTFQDYVTFKGQNLSGGTADGGPQHMRACFAKETAPSAMPPAPTYTPGNMNVLVERLEQPCNICIIWDAVPYKDDNGNEQIFPAHMQWMNQVSQANMPAGSQWRCRFAHQSGCLDMCKVDANGKMVVTRTAVDMLASGEAKDMPATCGRSR